jgi:hypothetical protein
LIAFTLTFDLFAITYHLQFVCFNRIAEDSAGSGLTIRAFDDGKSIEPDHLSSAAIICKVRDDPKHEDPL